MLNLRRGVQSVPFFTILLKYGKYTSETDDSQGGRRVVQGGRQAGFGLAL